MDTDRIAALKEDIQKDLEAIERVERLISLKNGSLSRIKQPPTPTLSAEQHSDHDGADGTQPDSLRGTIEQIVNADPNERWTTQRVLQRLQEMRYDLRAKKPIYSVGQALNNLVKAGRIRIARKGAGSAPNIYRAISSSTHSQENLTLVPGEGNEQE